MCIRDSSWKVQIRFIKPTNNTSLTLKITAFVKTKVSVNKIKAFHNVKEVIHDIVKTTKQVYTSS